MLPQYATTIPAEIRDFPEWRRGRETYAVWVLPFEDEAVQIKFRSAREHLSDYLLHAYHRQPHITLFVCGFFVKQLRYNDDFTWADLQDQLAALRKARLQPFEIEIGGLNSFASAPFLEVSDPEGEIARLRQILSGGAREFRTAPYVPHLTVGLYSGAFPSGILSEWMKAFPSGPIKLEVKQMAFVTYRAQEIAGPLTHRQEILFR